MPDPVMVPRPRQAKGSELTMVELDDQAQAQYTAIGAALAAALSAGGGVIQDVIANRPAAVVGNTGKLFLATDEGAIYLSDGVSWTLILYTSTSPTMTFFGGGGNTQPASIADAVVPTNSSNALVSDLAAPTDGNTVTIDTKTYTFKTALSPAEGEVLIGGSATAALSNLNDAINHTGTPGTDYSCAAAHPTVISALQTTETLVVNCRFTGAQGNTIVTSSVGATLNWSFDTLTGGAESDVAAQFNELNSLLRSLNFTAFPA